MPENAYLQPLFSHLSEDGGANASLIPSLFQHVLPEILLPQGEAEVTVTGEIAPGVPLETSPQWIGRGRIVRGRFQVARHPVGLVVAVLVVGLSGRPEGTARVSVRGSVRGDGWILYAFSIFVGYQPQLLLRVWFLGKSRFAQAIKVFTDI